MWFDEEWNSANSQIFTLLNLFKNENTVQAKNDNEVQVIMFEKKTIYFTKIKEKQHAIKDSKDF